MSRHVALLLLPFALVACSSGDGSQGSSDASASHAGELLASEAPIQDRIAIAESAAPTAISSQATIMDFDAEGNLVELRAGTNGWLCVPDENPAAPGNYPACLDGAWQQWFGALTSQAEPQISGVGISYMLMGGPAASNEDPFAPGPPEGEDWLFDEAHLMVIAPDPAMLEAFPTEHGSGGPYVMWAGTPYAHLMIPVTRD